MAEEFHPDLTIDKNNIDGEWIKQAGLYDQYATEHSKKLAEKDHCWLEKRTLKAKLYKETKEQFELDGKKITEAALDAEIRNNTEYQDISAKLINLEEEVNLLDAKKWALVAKKDALDHIDDIQINVSDTNKKISEAVENKQAESVELDIKQRQQLNIKRRSN